MQKNTCHKLCLRYLATELCKHLHVVIGVSKIFVVNKAVHHWVLHCRHACEFNKLHKMADIDMLKVEDRTLELQPLKRVISFSSTDEERGNTDVLYKDTSVLSAVCTLFTSNACSMVVKSNIMFSGKCWTEQRDLIWVYTLMKLLSNY